MSVYSKISITLLLISLLCAHCYAQGDDASGNSVQLRNPFESWPRIEKRREEKARSRKLNIEKEIVPEQINFNLTGVLLGRRNLAIINGEVVGEGDIIEGNKVMQINQKIVILSRDGEKIFLEIKDDF